MGLFAGGHFLDARTGNPVVGLPIQVQDYQTNVPVTPDDGTLATGARGGFGEFVVSDVDAVRLVAPDGTQVGPVVTVEAQLAVAAALPFLESAETRLTALEARPIGGGGVTLVDNGNGTVTIESGAGGGGGGGGPTEWADIIDKPVSFPPAAHDHDAAYVKLDDPRLDPPSPPVVWVESEAEADALPPGTLAIILAPVTP